MSRTRAMNSSTPSCSLSHTVRLHLLLYNNALYIRRRLRRSSALRHTCPRTTGSGATKTSGAVSGGDSSNSNSGSIIIGGSDNPTSDTCPSDQLDNIVDGKRYCCPGTVFGDVGSQFCCVGAKFEVATASFASCFPFCTGSDGATQAATSTQSCATSIFFTNSDYSSLVSAAAMSLSSSGSGSTSASTTGTSGSSTTQGSSSSEISSAAATSAGSTNSEAGAAMVTSGPIFGGLVAVGGVLMAL